MFMFMFKYREKVIYLRGHFPVKLMFEKAFVDPTTSALELALVPDSLYYDDASMTVEIKEKSGDASYLLSRVDGNNEGYVREEGAFAQSPNYLYKILTSDISLEEGKTYVLNIERGGELPTITAETILVGNSSLFTPNPQVGTTRIDFNEVRPTRFSWSNGENAIVYDLTLKVHYKEKPLGGSFEDKSFIWRLAEGFNDKEFNQEGIGFYTRMSSELEVDENVERKFIGFDVIIQGGNNTVLNYVRVGQANLGITSTQDIPSFTNLFVEGEKFGRGIFGARYVNRFNNRFPLTNGSLDSLINGRFTKDLNFVI